MCYSRPVNCSCNPPRHSTSQGDEIRDLKKSKPDKAALQPHIDALLSLKADYKKHAGKDYVPPGANQAKAKQPKPVPKPSAKASAEHSPRKKTPKPAPKEKKAPAAEPSSSRGLSPPSVAKSPLTENGTPDLDHLAQHLLHFSYVAGEISVERVFFCLGDFAFYRSADTVTSREDFAPSHRKSCLLSLEFHFFHDFDVACVLQSHHR